MRIARLVHGMGNTCDRKTICHTCVIARCLLLTRRLLLPFRLLRTTPPPPSFFCLVKIK